MVANSTSDIIGDWLDEIKAASPFSKGEREALGDRAIDLMNRDYLEPRMDDLWTEYQDRGAQADRFGGMLEQLYSDPLEMDVYKALASKAQEDMLRRTGASNRGFGGQLESDMLNSSIYSMVQLANPMNQSWQTALSGQQVPIQMVGALNQADNTAWTGGANIGKIAGQNQAVLGNFIQNIAALS